MTNQDWLQAQYSVLGSALIDESVVRRVVTQTAEDDYSGACKKVYKAIAQLFNTPDTVVDPVTVNDVLGGSYTEFLLQLMEVTPTAANVDKYIALCKDQAAVLAVRELAQELIASDTSENVRKLLEKANQLMIKRQKRKRATMVGLLKDFFATKTTKKEYLSWPIESFNDYIFAEPGDYIILAAEPSVGKTAFALQCAWHWAKTMKVGFFSLETNPEKLFDRNMAAALDIDFENIKRGRLSEQEWDKIGSSTQQILSRNLEIIPASGYTTADIRAEIIDAGYDLVLIDYIQIIRAKGVNRTETVTNISIDVQNIAHGLDVTVIALAQVSRLEEDRDPKSSDLRESGQLEQDADLIMFLQLKDRKAPDGPRKCVVTKNKEGKTFKTLLDFDGSRQRFSKANRTGDVVGKYVADGKKARRNNRTQAAYEQQMVPLPDDTPVPFTEKEARE